MAQENIFYGAFPNDPNADAIRIAFEKTQNNFTELYGNLANVAGNVTSITAGAGITTSSDTGNVTINAQFSSLTVSSDSLLISGTGGIVPPGATALRAYQVNTASSQLTVNLDSSANLEANNLTLTGNALIEGSLITANTASIVLSNGNITLGNGRFTGRVVGTGSAGTVQFTNTNGVITGGNLTYDDAASQLTVGPSGTGKLVTTGANFNGIIFARDAEVANNFTIGNALASPPVIGSAIINGNTAITGRLSVTGNTQFTGNLDVTSNIAANSITVTGSIGGNGARLTNINAANITSGTLSNAHLSGNYVININGSSVTSATVTANDQPNITGLGVLTDLSVDGPITAISLSASGNLVANNANFIGNIAVASITSTGNIATQNLSIANTITAQLITSNTSIEAIAVTANTVNATTVVASQATIIDVDATTIEASTISATTVFGRLQLTPLTGDPGGAVGGQMYYNSLTGKFRGYNAVSGQWESLN